MARIPCFWQVCAIENRVVLSRSPASERFPPVVFRFVPHALKARSAALLSGGQDESRKRKRAQVGSERAFEAGLRTWADLFAEPARRSTHPALGQPESGNRLATAFRGLALATVPRAPPSRVPTSTRILARQPLRSGSRLRHPSTDGPNSLGPNSSCTHPGSRCGKRPQTSRRCQQEGLCDFGSCESRRTKSVP